MLAMKRSAPDTDGGTAGARSGPAPERPAKRQRSAPSTVIIKGFGSIADEAPARSRPFGGKDGDDDGRRGGEGGFRGRLSDGRQPDRFFGGHPHGGLHGGHNARGGDGGPQGVHRFDPCWICGSQEHRRRDCPHKLDGGDGKSIQRKLVCLGCRQRGHLLKECRQQGANIGGTAEAETVVCFNCGSNEHRLRDCREPQIAGGTSFAHCFICKQKGHLSRDCPNNSKGQYPRGGSCKGCGSIAHLAKDCPTLNSAGAGMGVGVPTGAAAAAAPVTPREVDTTARLTSAGASAAPRAAPAATAAVAARSAAQPAAAAAAVGPRAHSAAIAHAVPNQLASRAPGAVARAAAPAARMSAADFLASVEPGQNDLVASRPTAARPAASFGGGDDLDGDNYLASGGEDEEGKPKIKKRASTGFGFNRKAAVRGFGKPGQGFGGKQGKGKGPRRP
jgi:hypothetical protein